MIITTNEEQGIRLGFITGVDGYLNSNYKIHISAVVFCPGQKDSWQKFVTEFIIVHTASTFRIIRININ
jgi:hypothetical protein